MAGEQQESVAVVFTGTRRELGSLLLRGYVLLIPTIGLYRFWLTTWKRRFYWSNTEIGGDPLEYTGSASQLLLGFLMAVAVFVPLYGLFFYLSTLSSEVALIGYGFVALLLWFLIGYAIYRARDFRLSRTLWRGIRCDQGGSAWNYAFRRFFWSLLVIVTIGLAYPFMAADLWRYRYRNSWYGDRRFGFTGSWKQLVGPYYLAYLAIVVIGVTALGLVSSAERSPISGYATPETVAVLLVAALPAGLAVLWYQSREMSRMFSAIRLGQAALTVKVQARSLVGVYLSFAVGLSVSYFVLAVGGIIVLGVLAAGAFAEGSFHPEVLMLSLQDSFSVLVAIIFGYLLLLGAFSLMVELFLGLGLWKVVARGASITGLDSLGSVRARGEDKALAGEGLADALNVGSY